MQMTADVGDRDGAGVRPWRGISITRDAKGKNEKQRQSDPKRLFF